MRTIRASIVATMIGVLMPITVASAQTPVVNQGDLIVVQDSRGISYNCTAGYVDKKNSRIWTAGHCSHDGSIVYNGNRVAIGTLRHRYNVSENVDHLQGEARRKATADYFFHDISSVELTNPAMAGNNSYSGDRPYVPKAGDQLCRFGATTRAVYCGTIFNVTKHLIYAADLNTQGGDSGGPAWVPGEGYVGQAVGAFNFTNREGRSLVMSIIHREDLARMVPQRTASEGFEHYVPSENELLINSYAIRNASTTFGRDLPDADEFARILRRHEEELKRAEARVAEAEAKLAQSGNTSGQAAELAAAKAELDRLKAQLADVDTAKREKQQLSEQLDQARAEITDLRAKLHNASTPDAEKEQLRHQLAQAHDELTRLKEQLHDTPSHSNADTSPNADNATLAAELAAARESIATLKEQIAALTHPAPAPSPNPQPGNDDAEKLTQLQQEHDKLKKDSTIGMVIAIAAAVFGLIAAFFGWFGRGLNIRI